jgi:hypothetical protein
MKAVTGDTAVSFSSLKKFNGRFTMTGLSLTFWILLTIFLDTLDPPPVFPTDCSARRVSSD